METKVLNKNARNLQIGQMMQLLSKDAPAKKNGLEEALEDVAKGNVITIHTPKDWKDK